ncbi:MULTISPECIES: YdbL family protein [Cycloclasticus]|nr:MULTISPECIES: YdbL family protein [Cycloclasticus]ATI03246.1 DUF1318 domain-containing protein [Cycloclasticus sp. PY97N]
MMKYVQILLTVFMLTLSTVSLAIDLHSAKDQGLVGETPNGYLASPVSAPSADIKALISDINAKRKQKYAHVAAKVAKPLSVVEQLAGKKAIEKTSKGHFIQFPDGQWVKK